MALAVLLAEEAPSADWQVDIAHLHHGMREPGGDEDCRRVQALAERLGCGFVTRRTDVLALARQAKIGLEEAGRQARYTFFEEIARSGGYDRIALGHTATDRAETLLMNLFRGAGLAGLRSIPPRRGRIVRPLLLISRQETGEFCRRRRLEVCTDECNEDPQFLRNRLRSGLLPMLEADYGPGVEQALCRAAETVFWELEWTAPQVEAALGEVCSGDGLDMAALDALPMGLRRRVWQRYMQQCGHLLENISSERWEALEVVVSGGETGKTVQLPGGWRVRTEYGVARLERDEEDPAAAPWEGEAVLAVPGEVNLPDGTKLSADVTETAPALPPADALQAVMDAAKVGKSLYVRRSRPGDRFRPLGLEGTKKLQDMFIDNKVAPDRRRPLVVTVADGEIAWVVGHRLSERVRIGAETGAYIVVTVTLPAGR